MSAGEPPGGENIGREERRNAAIATLIQLPPEERAEILKELVRTLSIPLQGETVTNLVRSSGLSPGEAQEIAASALNRTPPEPSAEIVKEAVRALPTELQRDIAVDALSQTGTKEDVVVVFTFSPAVYRVIEELMDRNGSKVPLSTVVMDGLALERLYQRTVAAEGRLLVESNKGDLREVNRR
jgi:hypothetical protein